jgi:hypothetical protein
MTNIQKEVKKFIAEQNRKNRGLKVVPIHEVIKKSPLLREIFDARIESATLIDTFGNLESDVYRGKIIMLIIEAFRRGVNVGRRHRRLIAPGLVRQALKLQREGGNQNTNWMKAFLTDAEYSAAVKAAKPR